MAWTFALCMMDRSYNKKKRDIYHATVNHAGKDPVKSELSKGQNGWRPAFDAEMALDEDWKIKENFNVLV